MSFRLAVFVLLLSATAGLTACRRDSGSERRFELKGKVVNVDKRGRSVTIAHEAIPGYMEAMTMPFKLKDEWPLDVMAPGDELRATLVVVGARSWLEEVVTVRAAPAEAQTAAVEGAAEPEEGAEVPDLALVNQDGKRIHLQQYRGQTLVVTFIYTRCPLPDYCPLMTQNFVEIHRAVAGDPVAYPVTHLLSITVDPDYDRPPVLRQYAAAQAGGGAELFKSWEFATGSTTEVKKTAEYFGLQYWQEAGQINHSLRTAIITPDGKLFKLHRGNDWKPEDILSDLKRMKGTESATGKTSGAIHRGVGVVESIDMQTGTLQINHEDIKDFPPAMSMPYPVKDKAMLEQVQTGDRLDFALQATAAGTVVVEIKKR